MTKYKQVNCHCSGAVFDSLVHDTVEGEGIPLLQVCHIISGLVILCTILSVSMLFQQSVASAYRIALSLVISAACHLSSLSFVRLICFPTNFNHQYITSTQIA